MKIYWKTIVTIFVSLKLTCIRVNADLLYQKQWKVATKGVFWGIKSTFEMKMKSSNPWKTKDFINQC